MKESDRDKMAIAMLDLAKKCLLTVRKRHMKIVIDAEHRLLCFIAIYERQKAMGATPLFGVPYYPSKFASTSLILRAIITYRHKKQLFISNRMSLKEPIEKKVSMCHRTRILSF